LSEGDIILNLATKAKSNLEIWCCRFKIQIKI